MTHLNIQQGLNISELVSANIIKKLYEAALSVPEPLEGELDAAYMSGRLEVPKSYRNQVLYLAGNINGEPNASGRFPDLRIDVTNTYYIDFLDPNVLAVLMANNISSDGVGITESDAASANLLTKFANNSNITTFNEFKYFTSVNKTDTGSAQTFINCTNLSEIDLTEWEVALLRLFENTAITTVNAPKLSRYGSAWGASGVFQTNSHLTTVQSLGHVTKITQNMFGGCINLETVNLPQECTTIEKEAFIISYNQGGGHLATINLDNITTIGNSAFQELRRLAKTLPTDMPSLTSIGNTAFINCVALTGSINYPNLTFLGWGAFKGCTGITSVLSFGSITNIQDGCFLNCSSLATVDFTGITSIGDNAFQNCPITGTLNIPNLTSLGRNAFNNTRITSILSLGTISSLAEGVFGSMTNLTSVTLPSTLRTISWGTFNGCTSLTKLIIPEGVTSITQQQPNLMTSLIYIEVPSTVTDMGKCFHRFLEQNLNESVFIVIKAENPPALAFYNSSETASNNYYNTNSLYGIYVPNVTTYQNASGPWQSLKILSKLKPISQLQTDNPTLWADYLSRISQS